MTFVSYLKGNTGDASSLAANTMLSRLDNVRYCIVSEYAATQIAIMIGPEFVKSRYANLAMQGWLLELCFFASISKGGFKFKYQESSDQHISKESCYLPFDRTQLTDDIITDLNNKVKRWLKPKKWNQGGYDAVVSFFK